MFLTPTDLAKYPFTPQAAEYVQKLDFKITELTNPEYDRIIERAEKRVEEAILHALVSDESRSEEIEILSFPIAVMIVAAADDSHLKRRYALAEAKRVYNILKQENNIKNLTEVAQEFHWKLNSAKINTRLPQTATSTLTLHFANYLKNAANFHEDKWKLINRTMIKGEVHLTREEAARLLAEEVRDHIERRLDVKVGFNLPEAVAERAEKLKQLFFSKRGEIRLEEMPKETVIDAFPPCINQLYNAALAGRHLSHMGRFALTSFLLSSGMTVENVMECFRPSSDFSERLTRYQVEHIAGGRGSRNKYIPPKCDTLRTHGLCPGIDDICRGVRHPLTYYLRKVRQIKPQAQAATARA